MAIELELKYFFTDHDPLGEWVPEKPSDVYFWVGMAIGEVGVEGTFWFDVIVATPEGVNMHHQGEVLDDFVRTQKRGYPLKTGQKALVVVDHYDWDSVYSVLREMVASCERETWEESLDCLREAFFWEYEDIKVFDDSVMDVLIKERVSDEEIREFMAAIFLVPVERVLLIDEKDFSSMPEGDPELACFGVKREAKGDVAWFLDLYRCGSEGEELLEAIRVACGVVRLICYVPSLDDESEQWYKINGESEMVVVEPLNDDWDCYLFSE